MDNFFRLIRRLYACRDQYHHLEAYLREAPREVQHDLALLAQKIQEYEHLMDQKARITSRAISNMIRRGLR